LLAVACAGCSPQSYPQNLSINPECLLVRSLLASVAIKSDDVFVLLFFQSMKIHISLLEMCHVLG
jgi:hypothetical protein